MSLSSENKALAEQVIRLRMLQLMKQIQDGEEIAAGDFASVIRAYGMFEEETKYDNFVSFDGLSDEELLQQFDPPTLIENVARRPSRETSGHVGRKGQGLISSGDPDA